MTPYRAWEGLSPQDPRASIGRGEALFNKRSFTVKNVRGLNDVLGQEAIPLTCTACHDTPNAGNHSVPFPVDIGLTDPSRRTPDMPLYTLKNKATGELYQTTDPGRALVTAKWADRGKFKGPMLRALAARPPYFHDGSAARLEDAVKFYDERFEIGLTDAEKADLTAFLKAL
jgi:cytochrome c peroxidase